MAQAIELLKFCEKIFKSMSEIGVKTDDCRHIAMYDEYKQMESKGFKKEYIRAKIARKYKVSETSVYRIVNRLDKHIKI